KTMAVVSPVAHAIGSSKFKAASTLVALLGGGAVRDGRHFHPLAAGSAAGAESRAADALRRRGCGRVVRRMAPRGAGGGRWVYGGELSVRSATLRFQVHGGCRRDGHRLLAVLRHHHLSGRSDAAGPTARGGARRKVGT